MTLEALFSLEKDDELLSFRFAYDGFLMWPFIRFPLFLEALAVEHGFRVLEPIRRFSTYRTLKYLIQSWVENPLRMKGPSDILLFGSTAGVSVLRNGKWFGRVNDYYALLEEERTVVIDKSQDREFKRPRTPRRIAAQDWISIRAEVGRLFMGQNSKDKTRIDQFIAYLRDKIPQTLDDSVWSYLAETLKRVGGRLVGLHNGYRRLFDRLRPTLVLLEDASYGSEAYLVKWAKDAGIITAEIQHGLIVPSHHAYRFGNGLFASTDYGRYLPDFLLTYGSFWSNNARTPSEKIVIGNAHLTESTRGWTKSVGRDHRPTMIIISQPDVVDHLTSLAMDFSREWGSRGHIIYRLHPTEVPHRNDYSALEERSNITISDAGDIYDLLRQADGVIGSSSTVLFEAVGFRIPVYVHDNPGSRLYVPLNFGRWFKTARELMSLMETTDPSPPDPALYWAPEWQANYRRFLSERIFKPREVSS
ncbi:MAG: hypothetical protein JNK54_03670 [Elusimicrobia bacterium]|jgi:hypothetical protein|nr:hypothetical protein [Elusimicrobiota bacterium]